MSVITMRYSLEDFHTICANGHNYKLSQDVLSTISKIVLEVGSPSYVKTPVFNKKSYIKSDTNDSIIKRRKPIKKETATFQSTYKSNIVDNKTGIAAHIDTIRSYLNKLSDKNVTDITNKIIELIDQIMNESEVTEETKNTELSNVSKIIFNIASTNRFYSAIYADVYSQLVTKYELIRQTFEANLNVFLDLFNNIEYVDASVDYDKFCKINKDNEKRKALSAFFVNLMNKNIITKSKIIEITQTLAGLLYNYISEDDRKNEVNEIAENMFILYNKKFDSDYNAVIIGNEPINSFIKRLSKSKVNDYKSLSSKTIFKFMDLMEQ
jgi:hypothetical protein